eukprot:scaffold20920_cov67-Phaeocystis_antarctica.AAC.5
MCGESLGSFEKSRGETPRIVGERMLDRYINFRLAGGRRVTLGLTKAKAQLASMPRGGMRSGCGPATSTDVYATREQFWLATRASAIVVVLSSSSAGSVSTSRAISRAAAGRRGQRLLMTLAQLVEATNGASVGWHEDVRRALKGQQGLPDEVDAQPRARERPSHQLLGVAAINTRLAVTARRVHA